MMDIDLDTVITNSMDDVNMHQIRNNKFSVDVLPGIFFEGNYNFKGDGILLPLNLVACINDLNIIGYVQLKFNVGDREYYCFVADYVDGDYGYVPGELLGDDFMPGQCLEFEIVNDTIKPATKVVLKFDDGNITDFKSVLEPWIGKVYLFLRKGQILRIGESGKEYNVVVCTLWNDDGECDMGVAYNTDLEIELDLPEITNAELEEPDIPELEEPRLTVQELREKRLAYFNNK
jgi:hypothetical protein